MPWQEVVCDMNDAVKHSSSGTYCTYCNTMSFSSVLKYDILYYTVFYCNTILTEFYVTQLYDT